MAKIPNPTGKGGFRDHPENMSGGYWDSTQSISYNYNKMLRMTRAEFNKWIEKHPEKERTVAQEMAYNAVMKAMDDRGYLEEVTDRTEGKATQKTEFAGDVTLKGLVSELKGE